jgi:hypothetical protein
MAVEIKAKHNESNKIYYFSSADWWNYSQTGLYTYLGTRITEDEPEARNAPKTGTKIVTKSGCGCGK